MNVLVDNDILLKAACYGLFDELFSKNGKLFGILGAARYVVAKKIVKHPLKGDSELAVGRLDAFVDHSAVVEPTADEQILAADFELAAQLNGVALDAGESQLCAVLITRSLEQLWTGDKRAIQALEDLLQSDERLSFLCGKVQCLEQLVLASLTEKNFTSIRVAICGEPKVDKTLSICFSCRSESASLEVIKECLDSYINDLRSHAPEILITT